MRRSHALAMALCSILAGCAATGGSENVLDGDPTSPSPAAHFQVGNITILPINVTHRQTLYEDDDAAIVRYVVRQDGEAAESAFITYLFNGRIVDASQITLAPGQEKTYERLVGDLRTNRSFDVEVRAGSSVAKARGEVEEWPRAGRDSLELAPLSLRTEYGLVERGGRVLANLSIEHRGGEASVEGLRARMLCVDAAGAVRATTDVELPVPTPGNVTSADASFEDCAPDARYGIEFTLEIADAQPEVGRLLLVSTDWRPTSTQA